MTCFFPKDAWRVYFPEYGHTSILFRVTDAQKAVSENLPIPCRQCIGCRLDYSRQMSVRIMHEAQFHEQNSFITLTFSDRYLPSDGSIRKTHLQNFHKSLRHQISPRKYRHYSVGEYGDKYARPHYHAIIFGTSFPDRQKLRFQNGEWLHSSEQLSKSWTYGTATVQDLILGRATYITGYVTKKLNGDHVAKYKGKHPEFALMSNQPGLGNAWFHKYYTDLYPSDFVIIDGKRFPMPPYYDKLYLELDEEAQHDVKDWRVYNALQNPKDRTPERLATRERFAQLNADRLKRNLEE